MGIAAKAFGILVLAALCTEASAQLFKCTRPDGKIVYRDTRCEAAASGSALKVIPNSSTDDRKDAATNEQKTGARLEIASIHSGQDHRMSRDNRDRRDSLNVDLGSVDRQKRSDALRQLRDLY
jgi:hypothetical protein